MKRFLIPFITHTTDKEERHQVLEKFNDGRYHAIVTSKVLDEGIDVPEASLGVRYGGDGGLRREFIQRLGRLSKNRSKKEEARLVEIVCEGDIRGRDEFEEEKKWKLVVANKTKKETRSSEGYLPLS